MRIFEAVRKWFSPGSPPSPWYPIHESFAGAWQRNIAPVTRAEMLAYPALFACVTRIASDIARLPFVLKSRDGNGIWRSMDNPAFSPVLRKPNYYQTAGQFRQHWMTSRLLAGNAYILKARDARGVVTALFVLDPYRVRTMVAESGDVFYELSAPSNSLPPRPDGYPARDGGVLIPARELIHDRETPFLHPLVGVPPLAAAYLATTKNSRALQNAEAFFKHGAQPSGLLTAPAGMSEADSAAVKKFWDESFSGENAGRVAVVGADMKFTTLAMTAVDSQFVEQMKYSDEQICMAFGVPPALLGLSPPPVGMKNDELALLYHESALAARIESMEDTLDEGLRLGKDWSVELDLDPLLRMDEVRKAEVQKVLVGAGIASPNEARRRFDLAPVAGGDSPYLQQQNYSLEALARRDQGPDPFGSGRAGERALPPGLQLQRDLKEMHHEAVTGRKQRYRYDWATEEFVPA